ncbi:transcription elongation factor GreA [Candidatus Campbellbacteria bacterium CG22_combo_CG10-13_8_21_14_all_36_13]|uniref:Transcription elongation factor GreA n=1 Tax=Candidatus Campbellbacteria bacterium CG22_combo_CG10-13_8_21_14_all_36_13 TaxID=1974529 RepID=A0A2H0E048_9BACT|nr:MAG: transcription elongation factor GreA [Candidatus Campbellbacteria bacterium CG22_combo_CG10-13_8_21_14_all_36_13]
MPEEEHYLTEEKKKQFEEELKVLQTVKRKEIAEQLDYAKSLGDLSENAEYHQARAEQANTESRIAKLEHILKYSKTISHAKSDKVQVGSKVVIRKKGDTTDKEFNLVDSEESDMSVGNLSFTSPLGRAMFGKKKGEEFTFVTPSGSKATYTVKKVS